MTETILYQDSRYRKQLPPLPRFHFQEGGQVGTSSRLNVILPHLNRDMAFGGVTSALELARVLAEEYEQVRFLSQHPLPGPDRCFTLQELSPVRGGGKVSTDYLYREDGLDVHGREIFLCAYWTSVLAWECYRDLLKAEGLATPPFHYFIQDYEPGFYPFGYKHAQCKATYGHGPHCHAIFNSMELAAHFQRSGYHFASSVALAPSLNSELRTYLEAQSFTLPPKPDQPLTFLIYGRPDNPRNCFPAVLEGLDRYFRNVSRDRLQGCVCLSAGSVTRHPDMLLADRIPLKWMGKLSLKDYCAVLALSHVGVSLMDTPHPSYPPLEMATFGLETITNKCGVKDLSGAHPRLHSIEHPVPSQLAEALETATEAALKGNGKPCRVTLPTCMSPLPWAENLRRAGIPSLVREPGAASGKGR